MVNHYKEKLIAMVVDNANIHHSQLIQDFFAKNERTMLIDLPSYSPNGAIMEMAKRNSYFSHTLFD